MRGGDGRGRDLLKAPMKIYGKEETVPAKCRRLLPLLSRCSTALGSLCRMRLAALSFLYLRVYPNGVDPRASFALKDTS